MPCHAVYISSNNHLASCVLAVLPCSAASSPKCVAPPYARHLKGTKFLPLLVHRSASVLRSFRTWVQKITNTGFTLCYTQVLETGIILLACPD